MKGSTNKKNKDSHKCPSVKSRANQKIEKQVGSKTSLKENRIKHTRNLLIKKKLVCIQTLVGTSEKDNYKTGKRKH